jgi:hypothetical protein
MEEQRGIRMQAELSHERLDVYKVYLEAASLCGDIVSDAAAPIAALDHLDRAIESIGINFMHANGLPFGSPQRASSGRRDCLYA